MEEIFSVIEFIPENWRGPLIVLLFVLPRILQKIKHDSNGVDFKFFGTLPDVLLQAKRQREEIIALNQMVRDDIHLMRKYLKIKLDITEDDIYREVKSYPSNIEQARHPRLSIEKKKKSISAKWRVDEDTKTLKNS